MTSRGDGALAALVLAALTLALLLAPSPSGADELATNTPPPAPKRMENRMERRMERQLESAPHYGTYYDTYEPTFYTGFAPRADEAARVHLHVGRGNQLRITLVLSEATQAAYARDLVTRRDTYRGLVDDGRIVLTQNGGLEAFEAALAEAGVDALVAVEASVAPAAVRDQNLSLMERLNPGRVFRVAIREDALVRQWAARLTGEDRAGMERDRLLEVANALLPTRLWIAEMADEIAVELQALVQQTPPADVLEAGVPAGFADAYFALLARLRPGLYPRRDGALRFAEFTAIHPIGTFNDYTEYAGRKIPLYPTPGRRALTTHQRTHTVDHIPTIAVYSYSPWIPYMHVGTTMHNSFHTLWWRMPVDAAPFLPEAWREAAGGKRNVWLLSRGPMSSGCTHLTTGHIGELRQILPSDTEKLYAIDTFYNRSYDLDVFDIDGDLELEVMGVEYFIAYALSNKKPKRLRVRDDRAAYYAWLYAGQFEEDDAGRAWLVGVQDGRFVGRKARRGAMYERLPLYEAAYEPERFQFYRLVDIPFARELRKTGVDHAFEVD